jgi:hypothetical protein
MTADPIDSCSVVTCSGLRSSAMPAVLAQLQLAGKQRVSMVTEFARFHPFLDGQANAAGRPYKGVQVPLGHFNARSPVPSQPALRPARGRSIGNAP